MIRCKDIILGGKRANDLEMGHNNSDMEETVRYEPHHNPNTFNFDSNMHRMALPISSN